MRGGRFAIANRSLSAVLPPSLLSAAAGGEVTVEEPLPSACDSCCAICCITPVLSLLLRLLLILPFPPVVALVAALLAETWRLPVTAGSVTMSDDAPGAAILPPAAAPPLIPIVVAALMLGAAAETVGFVELSM